MLVDCDPKNISVQLFQNQSSCLGEVTLRFAYFKLWGPSCCVAQNDFEQFCQRVTSGIFL